MMKHYVSEVNAIPSAILYWEGPGWYSVKTFDGVMQITLASRESWDKAEVCARMSGETVWGYFETSDEVTRALMGYGYREVVG